MSKGKRPVLLVNPYIEDFSAYDHFSKPLGLIRLASYLREHYTVFFINALNRLHPSINKMKFNEDGTGNFNKIFIEKPVCLGDIPRRFKRYGLADHVFIQELKAIPEKPEYIFITSGMTYWYTGIRHTIRLVKSVFPEVPIILGGVYATLLPEHAGKNLEVDFVVPCQELWSTIAEIERITNLKFSRVIKTPAYDLLGEYYYAPVLTSVGCVYRCDYCASRLLSNFYQFPADLVKNIIISLNRDYGVNNFAFYDDALLAGAENHIQPILEGIIQSGIPGLRFYTPNGLHIRFLTERTAGLMKDAGFTDIRLSLESGDNFFQANEGNKTDNIEFKKSIEFLYKAGFERKNIKVYTLLNVPGQNDESIEKTMDLIYRSGALPMLAFYSPIPRTPDFEKAKKITDVEEPLFQNNTVYLYRSGFDMEYLQHLKEIEQNYRRGQA